METHWHHAPDGARLRVLRWNPPAAPRARVVLMHGHGEHAMRHADGMSLLAEAGFVVTGWDQRGHGRSAGRRGWVDSYDQLLDDARSVMTAFADGAGAHHLPRFLYGHSMGAQIAMRMALDDPSLCAGVVATAPWLRLRLRTPRWKRFLAAWAASHAPWLTLSTGLRAAQLSANPQISLPPDEAALLHRRMSARMFAEIERGAQYLLDHSATLATPCLLVQGGDDPVMDPGATRDFAAASPATRTLLALRGVRHEPHNDPARTPLFKQIIHWMNQALTHPLPPLLV